MSLVERWKGLRASEKLGLVLAVAGIAVSIAIFVIQESRPPPTRTVTLSAMRSTAGWVPYSRAGSSVTLLPSPEGRRPFSLSYSVRDSSWVGITMRIPAGVLSGTDLIEFAYRGNGAPNSLEFKLLYPALGGEAPIFATIWRHSTDTHGSRRLIRIPYADFSCWPGTGCREGEPLDPGRVEKIDFAVSDKPDSGDVAGTGSITFENVVAIDEP
jgi:hypothetical protein